MNKNNPMEEVEKEVIKEIITESYEINEDDVTRIVNKEKEINKKTSKLDLGKYMRFIKQIKLLLNLLKDYRNKAYTDVPWRSIALLSAAVLYFVNPFDVMPDIIPLLGFADDSLLFAAVFKSVQTDLEKYAAWKGVKTENLF
ncbi:MAG TPA: YkvA family protein [Ignavibacteria bacterium]|nr:YkvA family protein [Ignavibacteria bacterium]HQY51362.1 YkvA family protein [Ignavibacteria bacterium]